MYRPDNWVILKITNKGEPIYKLLAGVSGGYLDGDSWRMNSGIVSVRETSQSYFFSGHSGSVYECHKDTYGIRMNTAGIYQTLQEVKHKENVTIELMPEDTDWLELFIVKKQGD